MRSIINDFENSTSDIKRQPLSNQQSVKSDVEFIGWQETPSGHVALYNIIKKDHPLYNSTVVEDTLRSYNLKIPQIPRNR